MRKSNFPYSNVSRSHDLQLGLFFPSSNTKTSKHEKSTQKNGSTTEDEPTIRRGKEREKSKQKKITKLKKVIIKEREEFWRKNGHTEKEDSLNNEKENDIGQICSDKQVDDIADCEESLKTLTLDENDTILDNTSKLMISTEIPYQSFELKHEDNEQNTCIETEENFINTKQETKDAVNDASQTVGNNNGSREEMVKTSYPPRIPFSYDELRNQVISNELNEVVLELILKLNKFQQRSKTIKPSKIDSKKRLISGLKELLHNAERKKLKCVIIATNIEWINSSGGLNEITDNIIRKCKSNKIPVVFALKRYNLGCALGRKIPTSCVGILNYDGVNELFQKMLAIVKEKRALFQVEKAIAQITSENRPFPQEKERTGSATTGKAKTNQKRTNSMPTSTPIPEISSPLEEEKQDCLDSAPFVQETIVTSPKIPSKSIHKMNPNAPVFIPFSQRKPC